VLRPHMTKMAAAAVSPAHGLTSWGRSRPTSAHAEDAAAGAPRGQLRRGILRRIGRRPFGCTAQTGRRIAALQCVLRQEVEQRQRRGPAAASATSMTSSPTTPRQLPSPYAIPAWDNVPMRYRGHVTPPPLAHGARLCPARALGSVGMRLRRAAPRRAAMRTYRSSAALTAQARAGASIVDPRLVAARDRDRPLPTATAGPAVKTWHIGGDADPDDGQWDGGRVGPPTAPQSPVVGAVGVPVGRGGEARGPFRASHAVACSRSGEAGADGGRRWRQRSCDG
jgi:hypothetical protein